jgi:hypothetical protein
MIRINFDFGAIEIKTGSNDQINDSMVKFTILLIDVHHLYSV